MRGNKLEIPVLRETETYASSLARRLGFPERLEDRAIKYIPSTELLEAYPAPGPCEIERADTLLQETPGMEYCLVYSHVDEKLDILPSSHPGTTHRQSNPGTHYGQSLFEGGSARPVVVDGQLLGANLILWPQKEERFKSSVKALGFKPPVSYEEFFLANLDLISIMGERIFLYEDQFVRAYVRPGLTRSEGAQGIFAGEDKKMSLHSDVWAWPLYLPQEVYEEGGVAAAFLDEQRLQDIRGKLAENYGRMGETSRRSRRLGAHETLLFGPYCYDYKSGQKTYVNYQAGQVAMEQLKKNGTIPDGPGEDDIFFEFGKEGKIERMYIQPKDTNILAGTTRQYIVDYMAPKMGIEEIVDDRPITIDDLRRGRVQAMCMVGNAVNIAFMREVRIYDGDDSLIETIPLEINEETRGFANRYMGEIDGEIAPSHPSLKTFVENNQRVSDMFDEIFPAYRWS